MVVYVDDFLMSGPENNLEPMWKQIAEKLDIEDPGPMDLHLGCIHEEGKVMINDREIKTMTFNSESFFKDKIDKYVELCKEKG